MIASINWETINTAMKETKRSRRVYISKHVSGMCGVGKFRHQWKECNDSSCPRCSEHEDACHMSGSSMAKVLMIFGKSH
jgi:hypothetical protein